ncbi:ATP-binding cassette domain-containing protein, partial [Xanthomonas perforans]|uniref:ATP-binding cassette domain-containing protein n=1 Tax=Xanthomonas perforans TaxID=442694 RepID=UPI001F3ED2E8
RGAIHFDRVVFHSPQRPDAPALDGFDLHVSPGETVALVGPSGAGKSTVLSMLLRYHDPVSGKVRIDDIDLRDVDPVLLREHIALVPQQPTLFAASAADNIRYGRLQASDAEVEAAAGPGLVHGLNPALAHRYASEAGG